MQDPSRLAEVLDLADQRQQLPQPCGRRVAEDVAQRERRLRRAAAAGELDRMTAPGEIDATLDALMAAEWVVYSKPCLTRTETVVDYLGRDSHRIALPDRRLIGFEDGQVRLAWKDYRDGENKVMTFTGKELLRRFLLHVLPKGFMRIRHFGFLANRCRHARLEQIRGALQAPAPEPRAEAEGAAAGPTQGRRCPHCGEGPMRVAATLAPRPRSHPRSPPAPGCTG